MNSMRAEKMLSRKFVRLCLQQMMGEYEYMNRDCLYIVMPAYNEECNIEKVIEQWHSVVKKIGGSSRLVVINDGSKDSTYEKIKGCEEKYPLLIGIDKKNEGHGATILFGYKYAIEAGAEYIFQTDSDGQTLPEEFGALWEDREKGGLLIGYRKGRKDGLSRVFVTKVLKFVLFLTFGVHVKDANTPFRLMKAEELKAVLEKIPAGFNLSNVLMTVIYEKEKLGVRYYPITFRPRQGGKNSINMKKIMRIGKKAWADFRKLNRSI